MTPMGYLLSWRMTLAMQWLGETGISIADIAEHICPAISRHIG
jgi:AraC-like DNA-binding protein